MNWLKNIFSSGVSDVIKTTGNVIDDLITSKEEKGQLKIALEKELNKFKDSQLNHVANYDKEITARHKSDMSSDSWLSKNIRPLALLFLTVSTVALAYLTIFILDADKVDLIQPWVNLLQALLITVYACYFGSRGIEKVSSIKNKAGK